MVLLSHYHICGLILYYYLVYGDLPETGSDDVTKLLRPSVSTCVFCGISSGDKMCHVKTRGFITKIISQK